MRAVVRIIVLPLLVVGCAGLAGCGGDAGPPDSQFEMQPAELRLADTVRGQIADIEPGANPAEVGQMLVENLQNELGQPAAEANKETYQQILDAAQKLAEGDAAQLEEIKKLADTLPKGE